MRRLPLDGVRVADFSRVLSGPVVTMILGQLGAEVIRVESRAAMDSSRNMIPFADGIPGVNRSSAFNQRNMSKKSCSLNLKTSRGRDIAQKLVAISDVVVENLAPGVIERLGLGYSELTRARANIIMLSISGLGQTGPLRNIAAYGNCVQAYSLITRLTGYADDVPKGVGASWADPMAGLHGAVAVLIALYYRHRTGKGQYIEVAMDEAMLAQLPHPMMDYFANQRTTGCKGNRDDVMAPHNVYRCKGDDKWVAIAVRTEEERKALFTAMGNPDWTKEERFSDRYGCWQHQEELDELVTSWTRSHTEYEIMAMLQRAGVPSGVCLQNQPLVEDPQLAHRGFFVAVDHPEAGTRLGTGLPWKMSGVPSPEVSRAPLFGEHNDYVFHELLGISEKEIADLEKERVIY